MTFDCDGIGRLSDNGMTKEAVKCTSVGSQGVLAGQEGNCAGIIDFFKIIVSLQPCLGWSCAASYEEGLIDGN